MGQTRRPVAGDIYRHFKDKIYEVITIAIHSETEEEMVVYRQMYGNLETYVRPLSMFLSEVDHDKYPDVKQKYRFERVGSLQRDEEEEGKAQQPQQREKEAAAKAAEMVEVKPVENKQEAVKTEIEEMDAETRILMDFLDARTYGEKLLVLEDVVSGELCDRTINNMAISLDLVIEEGAPEDRLAELRECIRTKAKYECFRLN